MPKIFLKGSFIHRARALATLYAVMAGVLWRRLIGKATVPEWKILFEIGTLFWQRRFKRAYSSADMAAVREELNSCYLALESVDDVAVQHHASPKGDWFIPREIKSDTTLLFFHGGCYVFYLDTTRDLIALIARTLGVRIFAPDYRLSPENPHPAQLDDALAAYRFLLEEEKCDPAKLMIGGDSAGGHLTLMLLPALRAQNLPLPKMAIGICPWTDIGERGASLFAHNAYDILQGEEMLQSGRWLIGNSGLSSEELSPVGQDYRDMPPIYLQAGSKEVMVDMMRDFTRIAAAQGAPIRLDVWPHMTHEFQSYGNALPESRVALDALHQAVLSVFAGKDFPATTCTEVNTW